VGGGGGSGCVKSLMDKKGPQGKEFVITARKEPSKKKKKRGFCDWGSVKSKDRLRETTSKLRRGTRGDIDGGTSFLMEGLIVRKGSATTLIPMEGFLVPSPPLDLASSDILELYVELVQKGTEIWHGAWLQKTTEESMKINRKARREGKRQQ